MCGLPASGKSTLAQSLARRLGLVYLSTDLLRKKRTARISITRQQDGDGDGDGALYSPERVEENYRKLRRRAGLWLRRGVPVLLDGTFADAHQRQAARALAVRCGATFRLVQVVCDESAIAERMAKRASEQDSPSDANWDVYLQMRERFEQPSELLPGELFVDPSGGMNPSAVASALLDAGG
jgi:predicted kinase